MSERVVSIADLLDPPSHQRTIRQAHGFGRALKQSEITRFASYGVHVLDLANPWPVLADRVIFHGEFFEFVDTKDSAGEACFTFAVLGTTSFVDIAAWSPATNRVAVWCGAGFALGERQMLLPHPATTGLVVHRTPIGWLRAGRRGIVIVRPAFASTILSAVPALHAEDEEHARELRSIVGTGPHAPSVSVLSNVTEEKVPA